MKYQVAAVIADEDGLAQLEKDVNELIASGWAPSGGVSAVPMGDGQFMFMQVMVDASRADDHVLRPSQVQKMLNVSRSKLYLMVKAGELPAPFKFSQGGRASGWLASDIEAYIAKRAQ